MASKDSSVPEQLLQNLKKLASQMQEPGLRVAKIEQTTKLAEQYVALFSQYSERLEKAQKEAYDSLAAKRAELKRLEKGLEEIQGEVDESRAALESEKTLAQIRDDVGEIDARDSEFKKDLLSSNEQTAAEIAKTRAELTESEGRLAAALKTCGDELRKGLEECLEAITSDDSELMKRIHERTEWIEVSLTEVMSTCEDNLAKKVDDTLAAVSSCKDTVKELSKQTTESVSSCQQTVLGRLSSCEEALTSPEAPLMKSMKSFDDQVKGMGTLLAGHMDEMSTSLHATHEKGMKKLGQEVVDAQAHVDAVLDSKSKESLDGVKTALVESANELSTALNGVRTEFAQGMEKDRLSSIFENSARAGEILERLKDVQEAIEKPDTSVSEAVSELKDMLQGLTSTSGYVESLAKTLEGAQKETMEAKADLEACRDERDQLASEVERLTSDMDQLKTKLPATPRRSERDPGSDDSEFSPDSVFEQEMAKAADEAEQPSGPTVGDLQQRIQQLEEELRLSKESRQEVAENSVSKKYLDDALVRMTETLSLRDRNEVQVAREEQAQRVAALEKDLQESAKRADEAEKESGTLRSRVTELTDQVATLESEREAAAPGENEPRSRKRARLQQGSSDSSEIPDETLFSSMCSAIREAMDKIKIEQSDQPGLPVSEIVINMTRAFAFTDREERLLRFITRDQTGKLSCFGSLALSDEPPSMHCRCHQLQGGMVNQCLSLRVLDNATLEVEFSLVDLES